MSFLVRLAALFFFATAVAVAQALLDQGLRLRHGQATDRHDADARKVDLAQLRDARIDRQVGVLVDGDLDDVADAQHRFGTRRHLREGDRCGAKEQGRQANQETHGASWGKAHFNPFNPLSSVEPDGIDEALVPIGATSTCGAACTSEAGSVAGMVASGGSSGADAGR